MIRSTLSLLAALLLALPANAGGRATYSATDADGTEERLLEMRSLPEERTGAIVSFTRKDGTRTILEYAIECENMNYAYLGIIDDKAVQVANLLTVRAESDALLANELRPVAMRPLGSGGFEAPIRTLAERVCS